MQQLTIRWPINLFLLYSSLFSPAKRLRKTAKSLEHSCAWSIHPYFLEIFLHIAVLMRSEDNLLQVKGKIISPCIGKLASGKHVCVIIRASRVERGLQMVKQTHQSCTESCKTKCQETAVLILVKIFYFALKRNMSQRFLIPYRVGNIYLEALLQTGLEMIREKRTKTRQSHTNLTIITHIAT